MDGGNEILIIIGIQIIGKIGNWIWIWMVKNMGHNTTQCYSFLLFKTSLTSLSRVREFALSYDHVFYVPHPSILIHLNT